MNILKRFMYLSLCGILIFCLSACGKKEGNDSVITDGTASTVSDDSNTPYFTIGNLTVKEIMTVFSGISLNDSLVLSLVTDGTDTEYHHAEYEIKDESGNQLATVSTSSDLENKAASVSISWNYNDMDEQTNTKIVAASKTIITSVWPDYSEEALSLVEKTVRFETGFLNAFRNETRAYTANSKTGGFISANMSGGYATFTILYPNLIENV